MLSGIIFMLKSAVKHIKGRAHALPFAIKKEDFYNEKFEFHLC